MSDVILVLDGEGRYRRVAPTNPSLLYRPSEELVGRRLHDVFPPAQADAFLGQIRRALDEQTTVHFEYALDLKGTPVRFSAAVSPLPGGSVIWVARDVTEHRQLEAELRRQQTLAAMGSLVAGVAHEVRTPLFSVSATVDVLERGASSAEEERELKELLRSQVRRLSNLMQDLLDYGSPPRLRLERRAPADPVRRAAATCERLAADAGVQLRVDVSEGLRDLDLDMVRLEQVFQNLIANAVQHSPRAGTVRITLDPVEGPRPGIAFRVEDDGAGIPSSDLERVFEPFFSRRKGGTGLGLSIAQRVVESHGGVLTAANRPGRGAVFTVFLPQVSSEREAVRI
jgi:PAS domain S-box-containing protein